MMGGYDKGFYCSIVPSLINSLQEYNKNDRNNKLIAVINNAAWCLGHLCPRLPDDTCSFAEEIFKELTCMLCPNTENQAQSDCVASMNKGLAQNVCITIGKLGAIDQRFCEAGAQFIQNFIKPWCITLRYMKDNIEKQKAYHGICLMIMNNPYAVIEHFGFVCEALALYQNSPEYLTVLFKQILQSYKESAEDSWAQFVSEFGEDVQSILLERFGL